MLRAMLSVLASLALLIVLGAATSRVSQQHRAHAIAQAVNKDLSVWPRCHTASCREAFSPDSLKAGYMDPAMALHLQFADRVLNNQ